MRVEERESLWYPPHCNAALFLLQILMNVFRIKVAVMTHVPTVLEVLHVAVTRDLN